MEAKERVKNLVGENIFNGISNLVGKIHEKSVTPLVRAVPDWMTSKYGLPVSSGCSTTFLLMQFREGDVIPPHVEQYTERVVCLEGQYKDAHGRVHGVGEVEDLRPGDTHEIVALSPTKLFMQWIPALSFEDIAKLKF